MSAVRIKICGVRDPAMARTASSAGADFVGIVQAPRSPRHVDPATARTIAAALPDVTTPVALFQLSSLAELDAADWPHEWVQLHGDEDETLVEAVARRHRVIRGFPFTPEAARRWDACDGVAVLLTDGAAGGGGQGFDHEALAAVLPELVKPVMLAGGLDAGNVREAIERVQPWGVDVSSGVESARGVKDEAKVRAFCAAALESR